MPPMREPPRAAEFRDSHNRVCYEPSGPLTGRAKELPRDESNPILGEQE